MARHYGYSNNVPSTPEEMCEFLADSARVNAQLQGKSKAQQADFFRQYAANFNAADPGAGAQLREQIQLGMAEFLRDSGYRAGAPVNLAPGAAVESAGFESMGQFMGAVAQDCGAAKTLRDGPGLASRLASLSEIQNAFGTDVPSDGGFLVPEQFRSDLLMLSLEKGVIRPRATVIPMGSQTLALPAVDATSDVSSLLGGIVMYWVDESSAPTETSAK